MSSASNFQIPAYIDATAMTATITGAWIPIAAVDNISFQVVSTAAGTPVGAISFEVTNARGVAANPGTGTPPLPASSASATALTLTSAQSTAATINNNTLNFVFEFTQMSEAFMRMVYTRSSGGSGDTMTVGVMAKAQS